MTIADTQALQREEIIDIVKGRGRAYPIQVWKLFAHPMSLSYVSVVLRECETLGLLSSRVLPDPTHRKLMRRYYSVPD